MQSVTPTRLATPHRVAEPTVNVIALAAAFAGASANMIAGAIGRRTHPSSVLIVSGPTGLAVAFAVVFVSGSPLSMDGLVWGSLAGVMGGIALPLAYIAFARGPIGVVVAAMSSMSAVVLSVSGVAAGAEVTPAVLCGLILTVLSILLVTRSVRLRVPVQSEAIARSLWSRIGQGAGLAVLAGVRWGCYATALSRAATESEFTPLAVSRIFLLVGVLVYWWGTRRVRVLTQSPATKKLSYVALAALTGALETVGNVLLVISFSFSSLLLVSVASATGPAMAAVLAAIILKERLRPVHIAGIIIGAAGVTVASL